MVVPKLRSVWNQTKRSPSYLSSVLRASTSAAVVASLAATALSHSQLYFKTRSQDFIECFIAKFFSTLVFFLPDPTSQLLYWNMIQMAVQSDPIPAAAGAVHKVTKSKRFTAGQSAAKILSRDM